VETDLYNPVRWGNAGKRNTDVTGDIVLLETINNISDYGGYFLYNAGLSVAIMCKAARLM
jgi:hypothetical protein